MPKHNCTVHNTSDLPLCITDPESGEVYCVMPGYSTAGNTEWPSVRQALRKPGSVRIGPMPSGGTSIVVAG